MMKTPERHTKLKVIAGYILLFLFTVCAIVFIYRQISQLNDNEGLVSKANQKLFIVGNTITGLYEAEALSNSFLQTGSAGSFQKYIRIIRQVENNIDSLKALSTEKSQQARIDTIHQLLNDKIRNLKELIRVKKQQSPDAYYAEAIARIESTKDSLTEQPHVRKRIITTHDTSYVKEKKRKGFLGWFSGKIDSSVKVTVSNHVIWDTLSGPSSIGNADTVLNILKSAWENYQTKAELLNRQISRKEYNIVGQSVRITEQLKKVLSAYETEEINHSIARMQQREQVVNATNSLIAKIAIAAILLIAFFCTLILKDISKGQRYRKEIEKAKAYTDQLLKSREKLILTVTHDIKSPLSSILGYIELLNHSGIDKRQHYYLKNMKGSSEHILKLITNLLDYSKLENNKMPVEEVPFNPSQLFREVCESFRPLAEEKHIGLTYRITENLNGPFKGDVLRIRQILANILSNAIKYTPEGSVKFDASFAATEQQLTLKITDTGTGMNEAEQQTIFNEFTRLSSNAASAEGTGLGLTITLKLIELLKGKLTLESQPEKGSCFTITLPLHPLTVTSSLPESTESPATHTFLPAGLKILLVDDDPLQLEMTAGLLKQRGYHADTTNHPEEVMEKIKTHPYDLLFTDIQMPGINGFELTQRIRESALPFAQNLPIVALSADSGKTQEDYLKAGFTAYLAKPFSSGELLQLISELKGNNTPVLSSSTAEKKTTEQENSSGYSLTNIRQFTDDDPEALKQILHSFQTETEKHLELLSDFLLSPNQQEISRLAHKMLPMFRQLNVCAVLPLLQALEHPDFPVTDEKITSQIRQMIPLIRKLVDDLKDNE